MLDHESDYLKWPPVDADRIVHGLELARGLIEGVGRRLHTALVEFLHTVSKHRNRSQKDGQGEFNNRHGAGCPVKWA